MCGISFLPDLGPATLPNSVQGGKHYQRSLPTIRLRGQEQHQLPGLGRPATQLLTHREDICEGAERLIRNQAKCRGCQASMPMPVLPLKRLQHLRISPGSMGGKEVPSGLLIFQGGRGCGASAPQTLAHATASASAACCGSTLRGALEMEPLAGSQAARQAQTLCNNPAEPGYVSASLSVTALLLAAQRAPSRVRAFAPASSMHL